MTRDHLWCAAHGWHNAGRCPDRIIAAGIIAGGVTTILATEEDENDA